MRQRCQLCRPFLNAELDHHCLINNKPTITNNMAETILVSPGINDQDREVALILISVQ